MTDYKELIAEARRHRDAVSCGVLSVPAAIATISELADALEAATAEQCVEVKPLEWHVKSDTTYRAEGVAGVYECYPNNQGDWTVDDGKCVGAYDNPFAAKRGGDEEEKRRILSAITSRPASEVYAEGYAAAIEAVASKEDHLAQKYEDAGSLSNMLAAISRAKVIRALHTHASRAALERIKKETA